MKVVNIALEKVDFLPAGRVTDDTSILTLKTLVFEPLLRWDNGFALPALFDHWTHSSDGRNWQFFIRDNAVFHDGQPCLASDVIAYIEAILQSVDTFGMKWSYARYLANAVIAAGPDNSVTVTNPEPIADILDIFAEFYICRAAADGTATLGTGRYRVTDFIPQHTARLERVVPSPDRPQTIVATAVKSADERYRLLKSGEADAVLNLERVEGCLDFDPAYLWGRATNTLSVMYYLNCFKGLFTSPEARLAVNHAIDGQSLIDEVFFGLGVPASTIVSPFHLGIAKAQLAPIPYDPAKARALLDSAGGPSTIKLRTPTFMPERSLRISAFVSDALALVGLDVVTEIETDRPEYARQIGRKQTGDMAVFDSSPQSTYRILNDKISSSVKGVWWQGYDDPEVETLIAAANNSVTDTNREIAYGKCLERLHANPPWLYLFHPVDVFAAKPHLTFLSIDHKGVLNVA